MELIDGVVSTTDVEACSGVNIAVMVRGFPRKEGIERKDEMAKNVSIYRGQASALEHHAAADCKGTWVSMGVHSDGVPTGLTCSFPVACEMGRWKIMVGLHIDEFPRAKMEATAKQLLEEKALPYSYLA